MECISLHPYVMILIEHSGLILVQANAPNTGYYDEFTIKRYLIVLEQTSLLACFTDLYHMALEQCGTFSSLLTTDINISLICFDLVSIQSNYHIQRKEIPPKYWYHQEPESFSSDVFFPYSFQQSKDLSGPRDAERCLWNWLWLMFCGLHVYADAWPICLLPTDLLHYHYLARDFHLLQ